MPEVHSPAKAVAIEKLVVLTTENLRPKSLFIQKTVVETTHADLGFFKKASSYVARILRTKPSDLEDNFMGVVIVSPDDTNVLGRRAGFPHHVDVAEPKTESLTKPTHGLWTMFGESPAPLKIEPPKKS